MTPEFQFFQLFDFLSFQVYHLFWPFSVFSHEFSSQYYYNKLNNDTVIKKILKTNLEYIYSFLKYSKWFGLLFCFQFWFIKKLYDTISCSLYDLFPNIFLIWHPKSQILVEHGLANLILGLIYEALYTAMIQRLEANKYIYITGLVEICHN